MMFPGQPWFDTDGALIQAHGGGVLYHDGLYYWYGENKDGDTVSAATCEYRVDVIGVSCYASRDLENWTNEGVVLPAVSEDPEHDLHPSKVAERPKVLYNQSTGQFVMWLHIDHADYAFASTGVAVSDTPTGPFVYRGSFRPCGADSRDFTVFKDDDGAAYLMFSSEYNSVLKVARLTDDYLSVCDEHVRAIDMGARNEGRESPAVFKRNGRYYMVTSGCTGWNPNQAEYATAPAMMGTWTTQGDPCRGKDAEITYHGQNTFVLPVANRNDAYILMFDQWKKEDLRHSRYVWLPIQFEGNTMYVEWTDQWDLSLFDEPH